MRSYRLPGPDGAARLTALVGGEPVAVLPGGVRVVWPARLWRWGVVVPVTIAALAGGLADVVTGTLRFWPLLWPSFPVIGVAIWRSLDPKRRAARDAGRLAELDAAVAEAEAEEVAVAGKPPRRHAPRLSDLYPVATRSDQAIGGGPMVEDAARITVGSVAGAIGGGLLRLLWTVTFTFMSMILIWGVIAVGTWGKGYWYVYGPALAAIGAFVWYAYRSSPAEPPKEPIVR